VADIKWIKLTTNMHDDEKMKLIDAMPERDTVHYLWIRLLIQAGKTNADGEIFLTEDMPYTDKMLAVIFSRPLASIKLTLKTLSHLGMIEIAADHVIRIVNWEKHQNIEGMERVRSLNRKRVENHREKKKQSEEVPKNNNGQEKEAQKSGENNIPDNSDEKLNDSNEENIVSKNMSENEIKASTSMNTNVVNSNSITEINNYSNVTQNKSNVTVMEQNKKEIKNENKIKNKRDIESEDNNIAGEINNKSSTHDEEIKESSRSKSGKTKEYPTAIVDNDINAKAIELMTYYEKITGVIGGINYGALRLAIDMHGTKSVKMAINKALEVNQTDMRYINGILKNWRREGYPKEGEEIKNGTRSNGTSNTADKNEFKGFKPKKPRNLTEAERKGAEEKLI